MRLISSLMKFGTFEIPLDFIPMNQALSVEHAERILSHDDSLFERLCRVYLTSFTHHHEIKTHAGSTGIGLRVAPATWAKRFWSVSAGSMMLLAALMLILGEADRQSAQILKVVIIGSPVAWFGIPFLLGYGYLQFCVRKLRRWRHGSDQHNLLT